MDTNGGADEAVQDEKKWLVLLGQKGAREKRINEQHMISPLGIKQSTRIGFPKVDFVGITPSETVRCHCIQSGTKSSPRPSISCSLFLDHAFSWGGVQK